MGAWHIYGLAVSAALAVVTFAIWVWWRWKNVSQSDYVAGLELLIELSERELAGDPVAHAEFLIMTVTGRKVEARWDRTDGARAKATA